MNRAVSFIVVLIAHIVVIVSLTGLFGPAGCTGQPRGSNGRPPDRPARPDDAQNNVHHADTAGTTATAGGNSENVTHQKTPGYTHPSQLQHTSQTAPEAIESLAQRACKGGVLIDWNRRTILWTKAADAPRPCASLTKMMTALLALEQVSSSPSWDLDREIPVTRAAARIGGSQVWLDPRETFTLDELLKCCLIFSANDAAYLLAESLTNGDVDAFVERMNRRARQNKWNSLRFHNPHGLPEGDNSPDNRGTPLDLACLAGALLQFPRAVYWSSTRLDWLREDTDTPTQLLNRNPLIGKVAGINGMKTGFTNRAGFCIAATCERDGRVLVAVLMGCPSKDLRLALVKRLLEWGYTARP